MRRPFSPPSTASASDGIRQALPIILGYVPIGMAYGVLGTTAGLPFWAILAMSVLVYAGSAQFLAVSLLGQGVPAVTLVVTTFIVNLRHLLYSSAILPKLAPSRRRRLAWVAAELTDESFVMACRAAAGREASLTFPFMSGLQAASQLSWISGSVLGVLAGSYIGDPTRYGLDFALVAMFIGLLALQMHGRREVVVALVAGLVSLLLHLAGLGATGVIPATLIASAVGMFLGKSGGKVSGDGSVEEFAAEEGTIREPTGP
ncbi:MAG TPA: AzlC family ABC transporter permease [Thermoleophilia bacterium]